MQDPVLLLKIVGAVLALALGIWIGLGMPGKKRPKRPRDWRAEDRLRATWLNRAFFRMERPQRRFGLDLITPGGGTGDGEEEEEVGEVEEDPSDAVRPRRTEEK
jgi:hypothetical protein